MVKKKTSDRGETIHKKLDRFLGVILQEIADVRLELKQDIHALDNKFSAQLNTVETGLRHDIQAVKHDIQTIKGDLSTLRLEVHQNQLMFMGYMDRTDKRLDTLEAKAA